MKFKPAISIPPSEIILSELEARLPGAYKPFPRSGTKILWLSSKHRIIRLSELEDRLGDERVIRLLANEIPIDDEIATVLEDLLQIDKQFWLNIQHNYDANMQ